MDDGSGTGMTTVGQWTGREAKALRAALRLSVRGFAEYLGIGIRTVTKWEARGHEVRLSPNMQAVLDTALAQADSDAQERFRLTVQPVPAAQLPNATAEPASDDEAADELRERLASAAAVDDEVLLLLATQTNHSRTLDRLVGARAAQSQLAGHLATLDSLRTFTLGKRDSLADLYADAAALAGWQCVDLGQLSDAWNHYEDAKTAGREGRSEANLVHAMAEQAYVLVELDDTNAALQLAEHAYSLARRTSPPLLVAWLWAVQGEIQAVAGNDQGSRRAFDAAHKYLPGNDCRDPDLPYIMLSDVHLARWRGNAWAKLGDAGAIEDLQDSLASLDSSFVRARAGMHVDLAYALMAAEQPGQAKEQLTEATADAARVGSMRQRRRIRKLQSVLSST